MAVDFKDESQVKEFVDKLGVEYRFGCFHEKNAEACHLLGDFLEAVKKDFEKAAKIYKTNCDDMNFGRSCYKYGKYALLDKGRSSPDPDKTQKAFQYFTKACELKSPEGCYTSGVMLTTNKQITNVEKDVKKGMENLNIACEADHPEACHWLSGLYITGVNQVNEQLHPSHLVIQKNMEKAFQFAEKACNMRNLPACVNLSIMYSKGEGAPKNMQMAEKYKHLASEIQNEMKNSQTLTFQEGLKSV